MRKDSVNEGGHTPLFFMFIKIHNLGIFVLS